MSTDTKSLLAKTTLAPGAALTAPFAPMLCPQRAEVPSYFSASSDDANTESDATPIMSLGAVAIRCR